MIIDFIQRKLGTYVNDWRILPMSSGGGTLSFDSMLSVDIKAENQVVQEAVEQGSFASYNKLASPTEIRVKLAKSGYDYDKQAFLKTLDKYCEGTDLLKLVTPSASYSGYNLESYAYMRDDTSGAQLLTVELVLKEVRQVQSNVTTEAAGTTASGDAEGSKVAASSAKNKSSASKVDTGKTQAKQPYTSVLASLSS